MNQVVKYKKSERGEALPKLIVTLVVLFLVGHGVFNYFSASYEAEEFKSTMKASVTNSMLKPPRGVGEVNMSNYVKKNLHGEVKKAGLPKNTKVSVKEANKKIQAQVTYSKKVNLLPFGLYQYDYAFNHQVSPNFGG